jgi:hypothetical protein
MRIRVIAIGVLALICLSGCGSPDTAATDQAASAAPAAQLPSATAAQAASATAEATTMPASPSPTPEPDSSQPQPTSTPDPTRPTLRATPLAPIIPSTLAPAPLQPSPVAPATPPIPANSVVVAPPLSPALTALVDSARADLAKRLAMPIELVELVELRTVVWSNKGLGCPQPGIEYLEVPEDGLLIRLRAAGQIYHYHTDGVRAPFLCEQKNPGDVLAPPPGLP